MAQPTPWQGASTPPQQLGARRRAAQRVRQGRAGVAKAATALAPHATGALRGQWGYLLAAIGNIVTFTVLFQPWVNAETLDGRIKATPFGKFEISSSLVTLWSDSPLPQVQVNGMWAVSATITIACTASAVLVNLWARIELLRRLTAAASAATALFVVFAVVHMNGKAPQLRDMLGYSPKDLGGQIGLIMRWVNGNGDYPIPGLRKVNWTTAGLTAWAWFAAALAVISAVSACFQWLRDRPADAGPIRLPSWRLPIAVTRRATAPEPPDTARID
ncbi:hypothetical protein ACFVMC_29070 [Nocardia sp. NPDC127579]|uniref:hypothetical protein n=1 Tax=Nocardia sp. NPDC127579 TaxID=3345402 RepID=UPI00363045BC